MTKRESLMQWQPGVKVISRSWRYGFQKRYWVRCWRCDYVAGPYRTERDQVENLPGPRAH